MKLVQSNKQLNRALEQYTKSLLQRVEVHFMLIGATDDKKTHPTDLSSFLFGEGAFGGVVWETVLLAQGLKTSVPPLEKAILHSQDLFHKERLAIVKRMLVKKDPALHVNQDNSSAPTMPSA